MPTAVPRSMQKFKLIFQTIVRLGRQLWLFPGSGAIKQRRQQSILDAIEAERLDRIRNPADYRGK